MHAKRLLALVTAVGCLLLAACSTGNSPGGQGGSDDGGSSQGPQTADRVVVAVSGEEGVLTPWTYVSGYPGWNMMTMIYDTLMVLDVHNQPQPLLTEQVEQSDDGRTWTLTLRDDVQWHDGEPFGADDVAFSVEYYRKHEAGRFTSALAGVQDVSTDGKVVTIRLGRPEPDFALTVLADVPIVPRHVFESVDDPDAAGMDVAVGTGPYRLTEAEAGERYVLQANDDYFLGKPRVDELVFPVIPQPATAFSALRAGEVDAVASGVPPKIAKTLQGNDAVAVSRGAGFGSTLLQFNTERAPLDRPEVRRAISLAIDVQDLVDTVLLGFGTPGNRGFLHPATEFSVADLQHVYDPDEARQLLDSVGAQAGPGGVRMLDGEALRLTLLVYADNPDRIRSAELIADMLDKVGIGVEVRPLDMATVDEKVWPGFDVSQGRDYDMAMWGWSAPVMLGVSNLGSLVHSDHTAGSLNIGGLSSSAVDNAVQQLSQTTTTEQQRAAMTELSRLIAELTPFVTLYYTDGVYGYRPSTYDGWVYRDGQGIVQKLSFVSLPAG